MKLGACVIYRHTVDGRGVEISNDYPAFVYKLYPDEPAEPLGLTVLLDGVPQRFAKVCYSQEPKGGTWRYEEGHC